MSSEQETKTNEINKTRNNMTDFLIHPSFLSIDIIDSTPPEDLAEGSDDLSSCRTK